MTTRIIIRIAYEATMISEMSELVKAFDMIDGVEAPQVDIIDFKTTAKVDKVYLKKIKEKIKQIYQKKDKFNVKSIRIRKSILKK